MQRRCTAAIRVAIAVAVMAGAVGCGSAPPHLDSTLKRTYIDPHANGLLEPGPGEPPVDRTDLSPRAAATRTLATFAQLPKFSGASWTRSGGLCFLRIRAVPTHGRRRCQAGDPKPYCRKRAVEEVAGRWYCSEHARHAHERLASALARGR